MKKILYTKMKEIYEYNSMKITFVKPKSMTLCDFGLDYDIKMTIETADDIEFQIIRYDEYISIKKKIEEQ